MIYQIYRYRSSGFLFKSSNPKQKERVSAYIGNGQGSRLLQAAKTPLHPLPLSFSFLEKLKSWPFAYISTHPLPLFGVRAFESKNQSLYIYISDISSSLSISPPLSSLGCVWKPKSTFWPYFSTNTHTITPCSESERHWGLFVEVLDWFWSVGSGWTICSSRFLQGWDTCFSFPNLALVFYLSCMLI